ncbi:MAG: SUMF1/EgtB/PvdO family nonheme iron enzyme, partial [Candidatus Latescibacteria bacterium]|nr:SUMF1/EgtB/PvdO family nonheme iron enzyme [Candidatus Latescibacterota bacterium]
HGDVVTIGKDQLSVKMMNNLRTSIGATGFIFTTNNIGGEIVPLRAATFRVFRITDDIVECRVLSRLRPLSTVYWFGAIFDGAVTRVETGRLEVSSDPTSATVFVNDERRGQTPIEFELPKGIYTVRLELDGFISSEQGIELGADATSVVTAKLLRPNGIPDGRSADFYLRKGLVLFDGGEYDAARAYLERAQRQLPNDPFVRDILSRAIAGAVSNRGLPRLSGASKAMVASARLVARRYMNQGNHADAKDHVRKILDVMPNDTEARLWWMKIAAPVVEFGEDGRHIVRLPDDREMLLVGIPGGTFEMGDREGLGDDDELPVHAVTVFDFRMSAHEVTVAQFASFLNLVGNKQQEGVVWFDSADEDAQIGKINGRFVPRDGTENMPITEVSWFGAQAFSAWIGGRLPTEAEWEFAARNRGQNIRYPTGDSLSSMVANLSGVSGEDEWEPASPVGSFPPTPLGLYDMAGNVWEWCQDWYAGEYYARSRDTNPAGPPSGRAKILRGGSWFDTPESGRVSYRSWNVPTDSRFNVGFRVVVPGVPSN